MARIAVTLLGFALMLSAGASAWDLERERAALLRLHAQERDAHLKGDADLLTVGMASKLMNVQDGKVAWQTREESRRFFSEYFGRVKYLAWDDAVPPEVRVSPDGKMAWMAIQVKARVTAAGDPQKEREFTSSWIAVYEKQEAVWKMVAIASGFEPPKK